MNHRQETPASGLQPPAWCQPPACRRRGVLLLVVLSLLVLFSLIGVTFVLVAGKHLSTTKMALRDEQRGDDPRKQLDAVMAQLVRDTTNPQSVVQTESLLADLYGNDGVRGVVSNAAPSPVAGTPFIDLTVSTAMASMFQYADTLVSPGPPAVYTYKQIVTPTQLQTPGYYNGCVLTMLGGVAAGKSTRIVGWGYDGVSTYTIRVMGFEGVDPTTATISGAFIVNGRPFNGTGFGFNPAADPATAQTLLGAIHQIPRPPLAPLRLPYALSPNPVFTTPSLPGGAYTLQPYPLLGGIGGADEDYDAADPQNMALAYVPINPTPVPGQITIIPSFHRPDLFWHVAQTAPPIGLGSTFLPADPDQWKTIEPAILRRIMLRPVGGFAAADHKQFTGSNPDFNPVFGPWDVDNDGDGIRDSVWIDVGFPVQTAPDGRTFKPLAAILVLDQDGRLNVNAHGNVAHVDSHYLRPSAGNPSPAETAFTGTFPAVCFAGAAVPPLARGQGYGPPEVSLYPVFSPLGSLAPTLVTDPPIGPYRQLLISRYAEPNSELINPTVFYNYTTMPPISAGTRAPPHAGITFYPDLIAGLNFTAYPFQGPTRALSAFGSPYDVRGQGFLALDVRGMPLAPYMNDMKAYDTAYEFNLSRRLPRASTSPAATVQSYPLPNPAQPGPLDSPFTAAELERVLRMYDVDAGALPDRLLSLVNAGGPPLPILRNMITTDSFDLPSPNVLATRDMRVAAGVAGGELVSQSVADLLRVRLVQAACMGNPDSEIQKMLPPELVSGQRMDINRPLGNAVDDSAAGTPGFGVVDEPNEVEAAYWDSSIMSVPPSFDGIVPNLTNGIDVNYDVTLDSKDKQLARHLYARHLYVLMMLLKDTGAGSEIDFDGDPANNTPQETARGIAQWAVNVIDFAIATRS
ncbi:MAG: hypothetical protein WD468_06690 [Pirellulales bacterium]